MSNSIDLNLISQSTPGRGMVSAQLRNYWILEWYSWVFIMFTGQTYVIIRLESLRQLEVDSDGQDD